MNKNKLEHLAIIMDGNGRWAIKRGKPRLFGHRAGIESLKRTVDACIELNIKMLSVYAFSTENWSRPKEEVDGIMNLITEFCQQDEERCMEKGIKVVSMGDPARLPDIAVCPWVVPGEATCPTSQGGARWVGQRTCPSPGGWRSRGPSNLDTVPDTLQGAPSQRGRTGPQGWLCALR